MNTALLLLFVTSTACAPVQSPLVQIIFNINRKQSVTDGLKPEVIVPVENPVFPEVSLPVPETTFPEIELIPIKPIMKPPTQPETEVFEILNFPEAMEVIEEAVHEFSVNEESEPILPIVKPPIPVIDSIVTEDIEDIIEAENLGEQQTETIITDDNNLKLPENTISAEVIKDDDIESEILDDLPSVPVDLENGATIDSDTSESEIDNTLVNIVDEAAANNENQEQNRLPDDLLIQINNTDNDIAADKLEILPITSDDDQQLISENEILGTVNESGMVEESQVLSSDIDAAASEDENNPVDSLILDETLATQANEIVQDIAPVDEPTYTSVNEALINEYQETLVIQEIAQESDVFFNSDIIEEQQMIGMPDGVPVEPIFETVDIESEAEVNSHIQGNSVIQNKEEDNSQFIVGILGMPDGGPNMPILEEPWYHFW